MTDFNNEPTWTLLCYLQRDTLRYKATDSNNNNTTLSLLNNMTRNTSIFLVIDRKLQPYILLRHFQVHACNITSQPIPEGISNIMELTLDLFNNNYHIYAHKISCSEDGFKFNVGIESSSLCVLWDEHGMLPQRKQGQVPKNPLPPSKPQ